MRNIGSFYLAIIEKPKYEECGTTTGHTNTTTGHFPPFFYYNWTHIINNTNVTYYTNLYRYILIPILIAR